MPSAPVFPQVIFYKRARTVLRIRLVVGLFGEFGNQLGIPDDVLVVDKEHRPGEQDRFL